MPTQVRVYDCGAWRRFWNVTVPMLSPYILFNARPKVQKVRTYYKERLKQS